MARRSHRNSPAAAVPGGWRGATGSGAGALAYFRWHGAPRLYWSNYSAEQLRLWRAQIAQLPRGTDIWCIFDNTASGAALGNALDFAKAPARSDR